MQVRADKVSDYSSTIKVLFRGKEVATFTLEAEALSLATTQLTGVMRVLDSYNYKTIENLTEG